MLLAIDESCGIPSIRTVYSTCRSCTGGQEREEASHRPNSQTGRQRKKEEAVDDYTDAKVEGWQQQSRDGHAGCGCRRSGLEEGKIDRGLRRHRDMGQTVDVKRRNSRSNW